MSQSSVTLRRSLRLLPLRSLHTSSQPLQLCSHHLSARTRIPPPTPPSFSLFHTSSKSLRAPAPPSSHTHAHSISSPTSSGSNSASSHLGSVAASSSSSSSTGSGIGGSGSNLVPPRQGNNPKPPSAYSVWYREIVPAMIPVFFIGTTIFLALSLARTHLSHARSLSDSSARIAQLEAELARVEAEQRKAREKERKERERILPIIVEKVLQKVGAINAGTEEGEDEAPLLV